MEYFRGWEAEASAGLLQRICDGILLLRWRGQRKWILPYDETFVYKDLVFRIYRYLLSDSRYEMMVCKLS
jgi:hypothetical protein